MKLLSGPLSMFGAKAEIAVLEKGAPHIREMVPFSLASRYEPKHVDVDRINPKKQVPVLIDGAVEIFDSALIFEYLEDKFPAPALWPTSVTERANARRLELESDEVFFPHVVSLMHLRGDLSHEAARAPLAALADFYAAQDVHLSSNPYLAGEYSYADIAFFMAQFFAAFLGSPMAPHHENLAAWRLRMLDRPAVATVLTPMCHFLADSKLPVPAVEAAHFMS